ncbi:hypothetical protein EGK75_09775 [Neisseria weixii]|uniref:Uncharacterized protein n=1 Tax=Neisseria weixii TaxID=1853276 RepID=A0A3N4MTT6_9NEIS|nr:hypothetical protein [Neisseria weixii]RPD85056.1 hypothetical protein EGK74_09750 [Neisseria weixii]RPD86015.1 hypothetical protein EGK75_09775 [Neisseria weixii]
MDLLNKYLPKREESAAILEYVRNFTPIILFFSVALFTLYQAAQKDNCLLWFWGICNLIFSVFILFLNVRKFIQHVPEVYAKVIVCFTLFTLTAAIIQAFGGLYRFVYGQQQ